MSAEGTSNSLFRSLRIEIKLQEQQDKRLKSLNDHNTQMASIQLRKHDSACRKTFHKLSTEAVSNSMIHICLFNSLSLMCSYHIKLDSQCR